MLFKELDFNDVKTQDKIKKLIKDATEVYVGEANEGCNMNDTFLNFDIQFALTRPKNDLTLSDLEE